MPDPATVLAGLARLANEARAVAIAWHGALLVALLALAAGWRPTRRAAGALLCLPLASVALLALASRNPVNGAAFLLLAGALALLSLRLRPGRAAAEPTALRALAYPLIAFGACYPHFLEGGPAAAYVYAAPLGLIPCPTLSLVIGFALLGGGLGSRALCLTLGAAGLLYGLLGVLWLGVLIDLVLLAGAAALLLLGLRRRAPLAPTGL